MSNTKLCPSCSKEIRAAAIKCKHCGSMVNQQGLSQSNAALNGFSQITQDSKTLRSALNISNKSTQEIINGWMKLTGLQIIDSKANEENQFIKAKKIYRVRDQKVAWHLVGTALLVTIALAYISEIMFAAMVLVFLVALTGYFIYSHFYRFKYQDVFFMIKIESKDQSQQVVIEVNIPLDEVRTDLNNLFQTIM